MVESIKFISWGAVGVVTAGEVTDGAKTVLGVQCRPMRVASSASCMGDVQTGMVLLWATDAGRMSVECFAPGLRMSACSHESHGEKLQVCECDG